MSNAPLHSDPNAESTTTNRPLVACVRRLPESIVTTARAIGFWTAIGLPILYLPLLAVGLDSQQDLLVFLCLLVTNVAALLAGRHHRRT